VAGSCEHGNEPSGSIKCGEFLDYLSVLLASQEGLCSMEIVSSKQINKPYQQLMDFFLKSCLLDRRMLRRVNLVIL
jgi:hypothetical protein